MIDHQNSLYKHRLPCHICHYWNEILKKSEVLRKGKKKDFKSEFKEVKKKEKKEEEREGRKAGWKKKLFLSVC